MKQILISGAGGFIGSVLCGNLLVRGFSIRAVDNFQRGHCDGLIYYAQNENFSFYNADITDFAKISTIARGCDGIISLAGLVGAPLCEQNKELAYLSNVRGPEMLTQIANKYDIPIVHASTGSVYGKLDGICTEESPTNPLSTYGITKLNGERHVTRYSNGIALRFATAYGSSPRMRLDLLPNELVYRAIKEKVLVIFQKEFRRTFIHIQDMCSALIYALRWQFNLKDLGQVYNVGDAKGNWTKQQLAEYIKDKTGCAVFYADSGYTDTDQRDYEVSYERMNAAGWKAQYTMERGVDELLRTMPILCNKTSYVQV